MAKNQQGHNEKDRSAEREGEESNSNHSNRKQRDPSLSEPCNDTSKNKKIKTSRKGKRIRKHRQRKTNIASSRKEKSVFANMLKKMSRILIKQLNLKSEILSGKLGPDITIINVEILKPKKKSNVNRKNLQIKEQLNICLRQEITAKAKTKMMKLLHSIRQNFNEQMRKAIRDQFIKSIEKSKKVQEIKKGKRQGLKKACNSAIESYELISQLVQKNLMSQESIQPLRYEIFLNEKKKMCYNQGIKANQLKKIRQNIRELPCPILEEVSLAAESRANPNHVRQIPRERRIIINYQEQEELSHSQLLKRLPNQFDSQ